MHVRIDNISKHETAHADKNGYYLQFRVPLSAITVDLITEKFIYLLIQTYHYSDNVDPKMIKAAIINLDILINT